MEKRISGFVKAEESLGKQPPLEPAPRKWYFLILLGGIATLVGIGGLLLLTAVKGDTVRSFFRNPIDLGVLGKDALLVSGVMIVGLIIVIIGPYKNFKIPRPRGLDPTIGRDHGDLKVETILEADFNHASSSVQRAMTQRLDIVNFYILVAAAAGAAAVGLLQLHDKNFTVAEGPICLLTIGVGGISFFQVITLRNDWFSHITEMDHIRRVFLINQSYFSQESLEQEFAWKFHLVEETIDKGNMLFFYSAITIGFMNAAANLAGVYIIGLENGANITDSTSTIVAWAIALCFFLGHILVFIFSLPGANFYSPSSYSLSTPTKINREAI